MKSKTSYFNKTLFLTNIKRFWPLWGVATFVACLVPLFILIEGTAPEADVTSKNIMILYNEIVTIGFPIVSLIYSLLIAMAVWSYLYTQKSINFYHSMPVSREGLFITGFVSGYVMMMIPYVAGGLFASIVTACMHCFTGKGTLIILLAAFGESFFFFALSTFVAHLCGNLIALPILYMGLNFVEPLGKLLVEFVITTALTGVEFSYNSAFDFLSPVVYLYEHIATAGSDDSNITGMICILWYVIAGVAILAVTSVFYKIRRSESAGDTVAYKPVKYVVHILFSVIVALGFSVFVYALMMDSREDNYFILALLFLIFGAVSYYGGRMFVERSSKVFTKNSLPGLFILSAFYIIFCVCLSCDALGIEKFVPKKNEIKYIETYIDGYDVVLDEDTGTAVDAVLKLHEAILDNPSCIKNDQDYIETDDDTVHATVEFKYVLKGRTVDRYYYVELKKENINALGTVENCLKELSENKDILKGILHYNDGDTYIEAIDGNAYADGYTLNFSFIEEEKEKQLIYDALIKDVIEGNCNPIIENSLVTDDSYDHGYIDFSIEFVSKSGKKADFLDDYYDYVNFTLTKEMTNTISALIETGALDKDVISSAFDEKLQ